jgi:hypothetical protein
MNASTPKSPAYTGIMLKPVFLLVSLGLVSSSRSPNFDDTTQSIEDEYSHLDNSFPGAAESYSKPVKLYKVPSSAALYDSPGSMVRKYIRRFERHYGVKFGMNKWVDFW